MCRLKINSIATPKPCAAAAFPEVHVWQLVNAKVTEFREFQGDEQAEDRFWS
jgi:hypothetical protein